MALDFTKLSVSNYVSDNLVSGAPLYSLNFMTWSLNVTVQQKKILNFTIVYFGD